MELRWRQPCSDPVAPCNYNAKLIKHETQPLTKQGSFTSVQMVHTHTHTLAHFTQEHCNIESQLRAALLRDQAPAGDIVLRSFEQQAGLIESTSMFFF